MSRGKYKRQPKKELIRYEHLTWEQKELVRKLYHSDLLSRNQIADKLGFHISAVVAVIKGEKFI